MELRMKRILIFITLLLLHQIILTSQSIFDRDRPEEYLGCFEEDVGSRLFSHAPGDYRLTEISPVQCMVTCGRQYKYAAVQKGQFCMCSNKHPTNRVNEGNCSALCPGTLNYPPEERKPSCGGLNTVSVYSIKNRILGFKILDPGPVKIFEKKSFGASIINGLDSIFTFDFGDGDGSKPLFSSTPNITHIYDRPGKYELVLKAKNNISGTQEARRIQPVIDETEDFVITCPSATVVGRPIECNGTMSRGADVRTKIDFGDGFQESIVLNAEYSHVGRKIPTFKTLETTKRTQAATFIVPSSEFEKEADITHWELDATETGEVLLQIFRPSCSNGEQYCQHNHSCIPSSLICYNPSEYSCNANEIFCMHRGHCIANTKESMSKCEPIQEFRFESPPADYVLVYQYKANITYTGHLVFELTKSEFFHAMPGDVLGWTFSATSFSGQVAYAAIPENSIDAREYEFPMIVEVGRKVLRATGLKRNIQHMLSTHFHSKASFTLYHVYNSTGAYYIMTNIAPSIVVYVDEPISGVELQCPRLSSTNSTFELIVPNHNGTNATYEWLPGDGRLATTTTNRKYSLTYHRPGIFMLSLAAYNSIGRLTKTCAIIALDKVSGLELLQPVKPVAFGLDTMIAWTVQYGTNVSYTVDLGDGRAKRVYNMSGTSDKSVVLSYRYAKVGKYNITITAKNIISHLVSLSTTAVVQIPLNGLKFFTTLPHITQNVYVARGDEVELWVQLQQGSDPTCSFRFGDGMTNIETSALNVKHTFRRIGEHAANVSCWNDISQASSPINATVLVQDLNPIAGLRLGAHPSALGNATEITLKMTSGSVYFCDWKFGDGASHQTDFKMNQDPIKHTYSTIGNYTVTVTCKNRLGVNSTKTVVPVDDPITGLKIQCPAMFLRAGIPFELKVSTQTGSRVELIVDLGQREESREIYQSDKGLSSVIHSYSKPGYYNILVTAKNNYNSATHRCSPVKVEYPVSGVRVISNSPLTFVPGIVKYSWFPSPEFVFPTDAVISWDYGDGHKVGRVPINFKNLSSLIATYKYNATGVYVTKVQIENNVSSISFVLEIDVQKMLPVSLVIATKNIVTNEKVPGFGENGDFFPLESELLLSVTKQSKDNWYFFELGNGQVINSSVEQITYKYPTPGRYNVTVAIDNVLQRTLKWKIINVQASIQGLALKVTSSVQLKAPAVLSIIADNIGSSSCYILALGDGNVTVFNNTACYNFVKYNTNNYVFKPLPTASFNFSHTYAAKQKYRVSLEAKNVVSFGKVLDTIEVIYKPCAMPDVQINGGGTLSSPRNILRSNRIVLRGNVTFDCDKASHVLYTWSIFKASAANDIASSTPLNVTTIKAELPLIRSSGRQDPTIYEIAEKQLQLGVNAVTLTVKFESPTHDVSDVAGSTTVWLNVQATPLKAVIKGGIRRAVGYEMNLYLDGSGSYDPDVDLADKAGIHFEWYCRRMSESFPADYKTSDTSAGCFKDGHYNISVSSESQMLTELYTGKLIQLQSYILRLVIKKAKRLSSFDQEIKILPGRPPSMDIKCKMNCLEKLNPAERLVLESVCTDCSADTVLTYKWSLLSFTSLATETEIADFSGMTTTGIDKANIAVKGNILKAGKDYSLKISAWKPGGEKDGVGFSEYRFKVNKPPYGGACDVEPRSGFSLTSKFRVSCSNWVDEDLPLTYQIDVLRGGNVANLYNGLETMVETVLPIGDSSFNFEMDIIAIVSDKFGYATETRLKVQVKEPPTVDMSAVSNELANLAESGNLQALTQQAVAAGSVMNKASISNSTEGNGTDQSTKAREKILLAVSKVQVCDLSQIRQMGDVYNEMTGKPEEVSKEAQDASSSSMDSMSDCMLKSNPQDPGVKSAALTMLQGSSRLLQANMIRSGSNVSANATTNSTADPAVANASSKVLDTVMKVGGSLMRQLVAGDRPTTISLPNMNVEMSQVGEDASEDSTGFKLPSLTSLLGNHSSDGTKKSVGAMVSSMASSPYGADASSSDIKSNVMGLSLSDGDGNPLDLSGQELQMFVKRDASKDIPPEMNEFDTSSSMRFHKFNYSSLENGVVFEVKALDAKLQIRLFIAYGQRPSVARYLRNHTYLTREEGQARKAKLPDPFTYVLPNGDLNRTGQYYVGLKALNRLDIYAKHGYTPSMNYTLRIFETKCKVWDDDLNMWTSKGCKVGAKTTYNSTQCVCKMESDQEVAGSGDLLSTSAPTPDQQQGSVGGAKAVQPVRKVKKVVKRVSFASALFVAPNPIDFDKAFAGFSNLSENPVAFSTVLSIFGVYLIMLFWARREDRKDLLKAGVTPLEDNEPSDRQFYEITVFTGFGGSAGTSSKVYIQLSGEDGSSEPRQLYDENRETFRKRGQDVFIASFEDFLGDLNYIRIWHDNSGKSPSWYLSKIAIRDLNTDRRYLFINESWLAVEEGDGSVEKVLPVAGPEEIASFNHLFFSSTQKNITDNHIWFSVFIRPPKSRFTRVQRLSCCLTLIYCAMLTNAMFYEIGGTTDPSTTLKLGPFEFSAAQIGIGIMSSIVIFPVNLLIVGVFRSVRPKPSKEELSRKKSRPYWWLYELFFCCDKRKSQTEFMDIITTIPDSETDLKKKAAGKSPYKVKNEQQLQSCDIGLKIDSDEKKKYADKRMKEKKTKKRLPYWMKYFAWVLLVLTSFTSAFFVVLYGFQFGKDKSAQWISSMMISFVQDVFVSQPIKIFFLGLFVALVVKKPSEDNEEEDNKKKQDEEFLHEKEVNEDGQEKRRRPGGIIKFEPPSKEKIKSAREQRLKEIKMYGIVKDIFIYAVFVFALCFVSYNHVDPKSYRFRKGIEDNLVSAAYGGDMEFTSIQSREDFWTWLNTTVVTGLFSTHWYNDEPNIPGFTQDLCNNLFGGARIRQLRVKPNTCKPPEMAQGFTKTCNGWYTWDNEDTAHYDLSWLPIKNTSLHNSPATYRSWEYQDSNELDTYPFLGEMALYSGGGYVGDLGKYPAASYKVINELVKYKWFDRHTRAIFLEATVYNAQVNLFAICNFVVEFLPTNGVERYYSVKIARLYTYSGSEESFKIACQFFVLFFLMLFVYRESKKLYKEKKKYFKGFWNWVELLTIILVLTTVSIYFSRMILVNSAVSKIHGNPGKFVSFNKVAKWDDMLQSVLSFLVMVSCIKSIQLISFNKTISLLASTLRGSAKPLSTFSAVFFIFYFAYVIFGFIIFVNYLEDFKSFITSMESTIGILLGSFEFEEIREAHPIIGPFYFITLMLFGVMYILNVFLTIVIDVYAEVKRDLSMQSNEYEIVDFMIGRFKRFVGIQPSAQNKAELETKTLGGCKLGKNGKHPVGKKLHRRDKHWKKFLESEDEISKKFDQIDKSLHGFCNDDFAEDKIVDGIIKKGYSYNGAASGMRDAMNYNSITVEAEYQQDLYDELNKWN